MTTAPSVRPLRVAVLDHTAALGGAELALVRLLDHLPPDAAVRTMLFADGPLAATLRGRGHEVEVIPLDPGLATTDRHEAGRSPFVAARNAARVLPFAVRLGLRLRRLAPDVVHTTSLKADLIGIPAAWIARRPLVWHIHDRISPDYLPAPLVRLLRLLARWVPRHVIVNSAATAATLPGVRVTIAHPGFSPDQVGPNPSERTPPDPPVVGLLGRISPTKGQIVLVRAAARIVGPHPEVRFRIIGDALFGEEAYAESVRREAESLGIAGNVEFTGFAHDPAAALDDLTLCVHASPTPEPFGQVVVEAMIRGVPVVATRGGGVTEIVQPDEAGTPLGWLVPPGDVTALAGAITEVLDHPDVARQRAEIARRSALERFPIERTAATISDVWRGVTRPPVTGPGRE